MTQKMTQKMTCQCQRQTYSAFNNTPCAVRIKLFKIMLRIHHQSTRLNLPKGELYVLLHLTGTHRYIMMPNELLLSVYVCLANCVCVCVGRYCVNVRVRHC